MCADRALPIYIVHWRAIDWCIESVASFASDSSAPTTITVIDNECSGGTELRARLAPTIRIIPVSNNTGYSGAANIALDDWLTAEDAYPMAIIASHDVTLPLGGIGQLESALRTEDDIGIVGPALEFLARYASPAVGSTYSLVPTGEG